MKNNLQKEINWLLKEKYGGEMTPKAKTDIKRLEKGEPADYVIGFTDFSGCKIDLSSRPLIPRPETEFWAEKAIEEIKKRGHREIRCLDIFAGSGCVGIAILKNIPFATVDFAEKNGKFLEQIKINCRLNKITSRRYKTVKSDVFSNIRGKPRPPALRLGVAGGYDYIFANPPYVAKIKIKRVQKSVLKWEPASAVFGGKDGLFYVGKFLKEAKKHLAPEGKIYLEFDSWQKNKIAGISRKNGYSGFEFRKDQFGKWRYLTAGYRKTTE